jgi:hypothetical protein
VCYFQLVGFDDSHMGAEVIRVFKVRHPQNTVPLWDELARSEVHFHAQTTIHFGLKLGLWCKVGFAAPVAGLDDLWFRASRDYGTPTIKRSHAWEIWRCSEPPLYVGTLPPDHLFDEIGVIFAPDRIVNRIETGNYQIVHPHPGQHIDPVILPP